MKRLCRVLASFGQTWRWAVAVRVLCLAVPQAHAVQAEFWQEWNFVPPPNEFQRRATDEKLTFFSPGGHPMWSVTLELHKPLTAEASSGVFAEFIQQDLAKNHGNARILEEVKQPQTPNSLGIVESVRMRTEAKPEPEYHEYIAIYRQHQLTILHVHAGSVAASQMYGSVLLGFVQSLKPASNGDAPALRQNADLYYLSGTVKEQALENARSPTSAKSRPLVNRVLGEWFYARPSWKEIQETGGVKFIQEVPGEKGCVLSAAGPLAAGKFPADFGPFARSRFQADYPDEKFDRENPGAMETVGAETRATTVIIATGPGGQTYHEYLGRMREGKLYVFEFHSFRFDLRVNARPVAVAFARSLCPAQDIGKDEDFWYLTTALTSAPAQPGSRSPASDALVQRGHELITPLHTPAERKEGHKALLAARNQGDVRALTRLIQIYDSGEIDEFDPAHEVGLLKEASGLLYGPAVFLLADWCDRGRNVRIDRARAKILYGAAYELCLRQEAPDDALPSLTLGKLIEAGLTPEPPKKAADYYRKAALLGDREASRLLARLHVNGVLGAYDKQAALELWLKTGAQGDAASYRLYGHYILDRAPAEFVTYLEKAAAWGDSVAYYQLGLLHLSGLHVQQDIGKAYRYFELAAKRGHADAMFQLWSMSILEYPGTPSLPTQEAARWCQRSAEAGSFSGMFGLGWIYRAGSSAGLRVNDAESKFWYAAANLAGSEAAAGRETVSRLRGQTAAAVGAILDSTLETIGNWGEEQDRAARTALEESIRRQNTGR